MIGGQEQRAGNVSLHWAEEEKENITREEITKGKEGADYE